MTPVTVVPRRSLTVVVADNDPALLELISTDLELEGHQVLATVLTGQQAVDACAEHRPDVLVVDYRMPPGMNGLEAIRRVRADDSVATCVLYTNYRSPQIADEAARLGAVYVRKGPLRTLRAAVAAVAPR
jgi:CheY-like chemotaxis protein